MLAVSYLTLTTMWKLNEVPYRDGARPTLTRDMGELFPRLSGIHTTPQNFERYASLKQIVTEQVLPTGRRFAMLQDYPGAHWLFGTHNPYGIDWDWPPDTGGFEPRLIEELEKTNPIAVMPKESDAGWGERLQGNDTPCAQLNWGRHAPVSQYVLRSWRLIGENRYFCLFSR